MVTSKEEQTQEGLEALLCSPSPRGGERPARRHPAPPGAGGAVKGT